MNLNHLIKADISNISQELLNVTRDTDNISVRANSQESHAKMIVGCVCLTLLGGIAYCFFNDLRKLNLDSFKNILNCLKLNESKLEHVNNT